MSRVIANQNEWNEMKRKAEWHMQNHRIHEWNNLIAK